MEHAVPRSTADRLRGRYGCTDTPGADVLIGNQTCHRFDIWQENYSSSTIFNIESRQSHKRSQQINVPTLNDDITIASFPHLEPTDECSSYRHITRPRSTAAPSFEYSTTSRKCIRIDATDSIAPSSIFVRSLIIITPIRLRIRLRRSPATKHRRERSFDHQFRPCR